jgi:hypothetical protein
MKYLCAAVAFILAVPAISAGEKTPAALAASLEAAVTAASRRDYSGAIRMIDAELTTPKSETEMAAQAKDLAELYAKLAALGELDAVERLSLVAAGESLFTLRVIEKREGGLILWTFVGYRFRGVWYCKGMDVNGGDDLIKLLRQDAGSADNKR